MNLFTTLKETSLSVLPVVVIVLVLNLTIAPIGWIGFAIFAAGAVSIIIGLSLFLLGTEIGIVPIGQSIGSALTKRRNLPLMIIIGFFVGFLITVAEPDVQVLAGQVATVDAEISKILLVLSIGIGVGLFVSLGFVRSVLNLSYRWILTIFYIIVFALAFLTDRRYLGVAFDAGGATTGPMTVPFIMALGVGVAAVSKHKDNEEASFGMVGLASIGPILAVLMMGLFSSEESTTVVVSTQAVQDQNFLHLFIDSVKEVALALGPLVAMLAVFQFTLLKIKLRALTKSIKGLMYAFIGLVFFFIGVHGAFLPIGSQIGSMIGSFEHPMILVPLGILFGGVVVLAEPAVWVLTEQVEQVSGGHIKRRIILAALSIGVAFAIGIAMLRVVTAMSIWWFLIPGYLVAITLTFFSPPLFTAIAFDSGGVASGPMSSTFILSFTLGASAAVGGNPIQDAFGVIAMIAMIPLIALQILGILVKKKEERTAKKNKARSNPK
ncbi:MAG: DUF1538 domain-containing protein [Sphaerochaetaceae bacterium]|nr:DUF1538 domain-containing protein [Spirochaetales bacterium]